MKNRLALGCLLGVIALCGLAVFLVWRARTPPQVGEAIPFERLPKQEQQRRRVAAKQLVNQAGEIARAARRKEGKPFKLTASEQQLGTLLQDNLRTGKFPIRELRVGLEPDRLALQGRILYKHFDAVATLTGNVVAEEGKIRYEAESLQVSGIPVSSLKKKAERAITKALNEWLQNAPGRIERVVTEDKRLTIEGVTD